jgi:tetratricopeptide (TPR) repeat protein
MVAAMLLATALVYADTFFVANSSNERQFNSGTLGYNYPEGELSGGFAGHFLSGHFAQSQYDWEKASYYIEKAIEYDPENLSLIERSMVLATGAGKIDIAAKRAEEVLAAGEDEALPLIIMATYAFSQKDFEKVDELLENLPKGNVSSFIRPLMLGWSYAAQGRPKEELEKLREELIDISVHAFHGALLAAYIGDQEAVREYTEKMMQVSGLSQYEGERIADMLVVLGEFDEALGLYKGLHIGDGEDREPQSRKRQLQKKIDALKSEGAERDKLVDSLKITNPSSGVALIMHDMATILYQEYNDTSASIFANLSLSLDQEVEEARLLLAEAASRNGRADDAIKYYMDISEDSPLSISARRQAAYLMAGEGDIEGARKLLDALFAKYKSTEILVQLGDIYRHADEFSEALKYYNMAANHLNNDFAEDNWYLLYVRGMVYEREGEWEKAEADLQEALKYRPNHPYLLNYLGYGWADQGTNLEKSLELIEKAVSILPSDGYITDSLGWVHYMMGSCEKSLPYLERAAELLPYDAVINDHLGDVYWCTQRKQEAKFQWVRAYNNTEDEELRKTLSKKIKSGLMDIKETHNSEN